MESKLAVDSKIGLQEFREPGHQPQNVVIRLVAKLISYIFHPLFVPVYIAWFLITVYPFLFSNFTPSGRILKLLQFFIIYSFFPLVTVLLAKALGFLDSIYLKTQKERVIPYLVCGIYYFWMAYVLRNLPETPKELELMAIAIYCASLLGLMANISIKVSMHAMSMGILVVFVALLASVQTVNYTIYIAIAVLIAGLVCTARLIVSDHTPKEIYMGLFIGSFSQIIAIGIDKILP